MRQQVNQKSSFFIKKDGRRTEVDIAQLRAAFGSDTLEAQSLLNSIIRCSGSLRGTRPFWGGRSHQLEAFVQGLGCPGIFLTFSAADLHRESLQRHMPRYEDWQDADNHAQVNVIKSWFRYEWQARGSTHLHGLLWIKDAPTLNQDPGVQLESINKEFLRFWGAHITVINPGHQQPGQQRDINPLITISPNPTFRDLAAVVDVCSATNVQAHTVNFGSLANIDTSPCTSQAAVINYVVKYVGKAEKKCESYKDIAKSVLPRVNSARGVVGFVAKSMNRLIAERDWSAQEIQHPLLNLDMAQGTRVVITVDYRHPRDHWTADFIAAEGCAPTRDYYSSPQLILEEEFEEDPDDKDEVPEQSWEALTAGLPQDEPDVEESDCIGKFPQLCIQKREYGKSLRDNYSQQTESSVGDDAVASRNPEQRLVFDLFVNHIDQTLNPTYRSNPRPLLVQVDGQGGTGKPYLNHALSPALNSRQRDYVVRATPTGIAANAINGSTLHSLLHLPLSKQITTLSDLTGNELTSLQARLSGVRYIILDEESMVGLKIFHCTDRRLRQVLKRTSMRIPAATALLLGDLNQLPPVLEKPLYATGMLGSEMEIADQNAYRTFEQSVKLEQVVTQQGDDQAAFSNALRGLRTGRPTAEHWRLLSSQVQSKLTEDEIATFGNVARIYPTNAQIRDFNRDHMERLESAVISIEAAHFGHDADSTVAGNLHKTLPICVGARVMFTENLWTAVGLVNGAVGIVEDIAWEDRTRGVNPPRKTPEVIMVRFEGHVGQPYFAFSSDNILRDWAAKQGKLTDDLTVKVTKLSSGLRWWAALLKHGIPTFRALMARGYVVSNNLFSRKRFLLTIAYAITAHRSQGTTLDKAVVDISGKIFTVGLSYVVVSRFKTLTGIMFETALISATSLPVPILKTTLRRLIDSDVCRRCFMHKRTFKT
ncbi:ATP-dependent DNA helicase PIF1 [Fusarium bulbicola]|nr:ATP-dependent DNA helicase PIF1 [Fusarium bulbicola]